jgi:hypothetical protein
MLKDRPSPNITNDIRVGWGAYAIAPLTLCMASPSPNITSDSWRISLRAKVDIRVDCEVVVAADVSAEKVIITLRENRLMLSRRMLMLMLILLN